MEARRRSLEEGKDKRRTEADSSGCNKKNAASLREGEMLTSEGQVLCATKGSRRKGSSTEREQGTQNTIFMTRFCGLQRRQTQKTKAGSMENKLQQKTAFEHIWKPFAFLIFY